MFFWNKTQCYVENTHTHTHTHVRPSVSPFVLFFKSSRTYLYQSCPTSTRTPHNNVKHLPFSWKPGSERHPLRWRTGTTSTFSIWFRPTNLHNSCPQKFFKWLCASWKPAQWYIYVYTHTDTHTYIHTYYVMVWMNWCCCFTHWLPELCEIWHKKSSQNGVDYSWVSCISVHGRRYICCGPALCMYRKIGTFSNWKTPQKTRCPTQQIVQFVCLTFIGWLYPKVGIGG